MSERIVRALLVNDDDVEHPGLLRLLNGYVSTFATSADEALAEFSRGGIDLIVWSCARGESNFGGFTEAFNDLPHLLIQWGPEGPALVKAHVAGSREVHSPPFEPLPALIANLVKRIGVDRGKGTPDVVAELCEAVITVTEDKLVEDVSPAAEKMFQCRCNDVIGKNANFLLPLSLPAPDRDAHGFETVGTRKDGSTFPMTLTVHELPWEGSRRFVVTLRDLTANSTPLSLIEQHVVRDDLTGLYHQNNLQRLLERALKRTDRFGSTFSLLLVDIDHLAIVNDMYGRSIGDQVMAGTARLISSELRDVDRVVRLQGDEILVILEETTERKALVTAERIRRSINHLPFLLGYGAEKQVPVRVTVSIGTALYPFDAETAHDLMEAASRALLQAKKAGHDCVVASSSVTPNPPTTGKIPPLNTFGDDHAALASSRQKSGASSDE